MHPLTSIASSHSPIGTSTTGIPSLLSPYSSVGIPTKHLGSGTYASRRLQGSQEESWCRRGAMLTPTRDQLRSPTEPPLPCGVWQAAAPTFVTAGDRGREVRQLPLPPCGGMASGCADLHHRWRPWLRGTPTTIRENFFVNLCVEFNMCVYFCDVFMNFDDSCDVFLFLHLDSNMDLLLACAWPDTSSVVPPCHCDDPCHWSLVVVGGRR
jgi:hypothetical protein